MGPYASRCKRWLVPVLLLTGIASRPLSAGSRLFFFELQGIVGYSSAWRKILFSSMDPMEVMQKPSIGFDLVQRISSASRDIAVFALQARLAFQDEGGFKLEPQLYNAYLKFKTRAADIWIGHSRPHFGLASRLDQHAQLLQTLVMNGFGFDRDWGVGIERDYSWGDAGLSLTAGSGMPLHLKGNYLFSGRISRGVLETQNYNIGFSAGLGKTLDVMGYHLKSPEPQPLTMASMDMTWLRNNWENRVELAWRDRNGIGKLAVLWRIGVGLLAENRIKIEAQPAAMREEGKTRFQLSCGLTYLLHPDWTLRAMVFFDQITHDTRVIFQVYYYKGLRI